MSAVDVYLPLVTKTLEYVFKWNIPSVLTTLTPLVGDEVIKLVKGTSLGMLSYSDFGLRSFSSVGYMVQCDLFLLKAKEHTFKCIFHCDFFQKSLCCFSWYSEYFLRSNLRFS